MRCLLAVAVLLTSLPLTFAATQKLLQPQTPQPQNVNVQSIQDPRGTDKTPFIVHENDSPRSREEAQREIAKDQKETSLHRWEQGIGIFGVICAFLQAIILLMQWTMLRRQTEHMITSERAWFVCSAFLVWRKDELGRQTAIVGLTYQNIGKTPGFIREIAFAVNALPKGESLPPRSQISYAAADNDNRWTEGRGLPIAPNNNMGRRASLTPTQQQLEGLKTGEMEIWVHGYIRYLDSFTTTLRESRYALKCISTDPYGHEESVFSLDGPPEYNIAT